MINYKELTGYWQYSPFSGWQLANNAMYAYRYVDSSDRKPVPQRFKALDNLVTKYFDNTRDVSKYPVEKIEASTFYMWSDGLPLMKYKKQIFKNDTSLSQEFKGWASMGPFYKDYGLYIIKSYPWKFIQHFIWPNTNKYYAPPVEFMEVYNSGRSDVKKEAQDWFGYKSLILKTRMQDSRVWVLNFYPILSGIINAIMLCTLICYIVLKGWTYNSEFNKGIILGTTIWMLNAVFTISASSVALRFQAFPILQTTIFVTLLIDWMVKISNKQGINSHIKYTKMENTSNETTQPLSLMS